ncbi:MAG: hypothetical protein GC168_03640 [Candidatus Hydrogenedens sp.]|nr:hypothetical protein [Candidatus Hydrogenedens sp.]
MMRRMLLALLIAASPAFAESAELLISGMRSGDEAALIRARQWLSREDVSHAGLVVDLLSHEDERVWRTAFNVLADWANETGVPGREADRDRFVAILMPLVSIDHSAHQIEQGLRLLPLCVPEGTNVDPIAALLDNPDWREKARTSLQDIGTTQARAALRSNLGTADTGFTIAVIRSLDLLEDGDSLPLFVEYCGHADAGVRAAAAHALARTGDPAYLDALREVRKQANPDTRWEAEDAVVRLACAIAISGGNWDLSQEALREAYADSNDDTIRAAALQGVGRYGDETALPFILDAMQRYGSLYGPGLQAIAALEGEAVTEALLAAFPEQPQDIRQDLVRLFGSRSDERFLPVLVKAAGDADAGYREAALDALTATGQPGAVAGLDAAAQYLSSDEDPAAFSARIIKLAGRFESDGASAAAGRSYLLLYRHATDDEQKAMALDGVKRNPVPEAYAVLQESMSPEELAALPASMLAGVARALYDDGKTAEADALVAQLEPRINDSATVQMMIDIMRGRGDDAGWAQRLGFVSRWQLVGPFAWKVEDAFTIANINEPDIDLGARYGEGDAAIGWQPFESGDIQPMVNLAGILGMMDHATAYAYAEVYVPEATPGQVRVGSDDGVKVWLNGEAVHENNVDRGTALDADIAPAAFVAGKNRLLVQITQGAGGWNFMLRLCDGEGRPLKFSYEPETTTETQP